MLSKLKALIPAQYLYTALGIIIAMLAIALIIVSLFLKHYICIAENFKEELKHQKAVSASLMKEIDRRELITAEKEGALMECRSSKDINIKKCEEYLDLEKKTGEKYLSKCEDSWKKCEQKLKECGGGINEECESFIRRSISSYYFTADGMPE